MCLLFFKASVAHALIYIYFCLEYCGIQPETKDGVLFCAMGIHPSTSGFICIWPLWSFVFTSLKLAFPSLLSGSVPLNGLLGLLYEVQKKAYGDYVCSFVTVLTTKLLDLHIIWYRTLFSVAVNGFTIIATSFVTGVLYEKLLSNYKFHENKCCDHPTILMAVKEFLRTVS
jgi:hypothetical protein